MADVLAKARVASGSTKPVAGETLFWKIHAQGLDGTLKRVARGRDWIETTTLGPFVTAEGEFGGTGWHQNENGEVVLSRIASVETPQRAVSEDLTRVSSPVDAYVIQSVAKDGSVSRRFYDPKTFLLVRRESVDSGVEAYVVYEDFVTNSAGRTFARHHYGGDQLPNNEWDERLISDDLSTRVATADVAIPGNRRTLVEFPAGRSTVRLPARILRGAIVVRVQIGDRGVDMILDSGASSIVLDSGLAGQLGLPLAGSGTLLVGGRVGVAKAVVPVMKIGALTLRDVVVDTLPASFRIDDETKANGLLGFDFLDGAAVTIDYDKGTVDATEPSAFQPEAGVTDVPARFTSGVPELELGIGPAHGDNFVIDTGAQEATIVVFRRFARGNQSIIDDSAKQGRGDQVRTEMIGGDVNNELVSITDITFGPWAIAQTRGLLSKSPPGFDSVDGLIGSDFLQNFRMTLDEPHGKLYLRPYDPLPLASPRPGAAASPAPGAPATPAPRADPTPGVDAPGGS